MLVCVEPTASAGRSRNIIGEIGYVSSIGDNADCDRVRFGTGPTPVRATAPRERSADRDQHAATASGNAMPIATPTGAL